VYIIKQTIKMLSENIENYIVFQFELFYIVIYIENYVPYHVLK
jgi:hypothetical protein